MINDLKAGTTNYMMGMLLNRTGPYIFIGGCRYLFKALVTPSLKRWERQALCIVSFCLFTTYIQMLKESVYLIGQVFPKIVVATTHQKNRWINEILDFASFRIAAKIILKSNFITIKKHIGRALFF